MSLQEDRPEGIVTVRWAGADRVRIGAREYRRTLLLTPEAVIEDWAPTAIEDIDEAALEALAALRPQLVLLGTGGRQRFLAPRWQAWLMSRGIGVESMDNAAAARTFNLLAGEGRRVVAAFVFEAD
jgi:uncharacterized protein